MHIYKKVLIIILFIGLYSKSNSQTIYTKFGKNRVQFHDDFKDWWLYDNDHYSIYWYGKERNTAKSAILLSQISYSDIEDILDYKINKRIQLIIYSDISDFNQTNLGIKNDKLENGPGVTDFYNNKVLVYFNGDHKNLLQQIRKGTAKVFLKNMFTELSFENIYKNILLSDLPDWFIKGAVNYLAEKWTEQSDNLIRNIHEIENFSSNSFYELSLKSPDLIGQSFFYFIEQKYGLNTLSDIFYHIRVTRNINSSFQNITDQTIEVLHNEWANFYNKNFEEDFKNGTNIPIIDSTIIVKNNKNIKYTSLSISNNSKYITYATNNKGKIKLFIYNTTTKTKKVLLKHGYINTVQITNYNYPLTCFDSNSTKLAFLYKKRDILMLRMVNLKSFEYSEEPLAPRFKTVFSMDFWDGDNLIISANTDGFDDIYTYSISKRQSKRLTNDFWDDLDSRTVYYKDQKGIIFSSNRHNSKLKIDYLDTIPPINNFNLYFLNPKSKSLIKLTSSDKYNMRNGFINKSYQYFKTNENGLITINRINKNDNSKQYLKSNLSTTFINSEFSLISTKKLCDNYLTFINNKPNFKNNIKSTYFSRSEKNIKTNDSKLRNNDQTSIELDSSLKFQSKFNDPEDSKYYNEIGISKAKVLDLNNKNFRYKKFISSHAIASRLKFSFNKLITKIDNEPLFDGMNTYSSSGQSYSPPQTGLLVKTIFKDMFEDHFLELGVRISTDLKEKEYFTIYDNLKKRVDWQYIYYRKTKNSYEFLRQRITDKLKFKTNTAVIRAKYPFDVYSSLSLSSKLRIDDITLLASDTISLNQADITEQRISLKLEYIFDNTSRLGTNLLIGNRSKVFFEFYNKFNLNISNSSQIDLSSGYMGVIGIDLRQYFRILNKSIFALRIAAQSSFGSENNLYFLGGMENWQFAKQSNLAQINQKTNYAYTILVANMRGFGYNSRNGSSFLIFNSEFRVPVFQYIFGQRIKKSFLKDFQIIAFLDSGLTWNGLSPFNENSSVNTQEIIVPPAIKLKIKYYTNPIIAGYGIGVRTTLFGYFIKLDYAWGIDTGVIQKPIIHLTMGYDF